MQAPPRTKTKIGFIVLPHLKQHQCQICSRVPAQGHLFYYNDPFCYQKSACLSCLIRTIVREAQGIRHQRGWHFDHSQYPVDHQFDLDFNLWYRSFGSCQGCHTRPAVGERHGIPACTHCLTRTLNPEVRELEMIKALDRMIL